MKDITLTGIFDEIGNFIADVVSKKSNDRAKKGKKRNTVGQETIRKKRDCIGKERRIEKYKKYE